MTIIYLLMFFSSIKNQYVEVEAENFSSQKNNELRQWVIIDRQKSATTEVLTASQRAYVQLLPDTRITHDDELISGINFSPEPGLSILEYKVKIKKAGKYYVWVKAFSKGSEDNGLHVGIDGTWPESGKRMQWCEGKNKWTWASKQRTETEHCGEPEKIFLMIEKPGLHTIQFSMREDGFAFDKFALSTVYQEPVS